VDALGPERIGHGIRSIQDATLLAELRERRVMLDVSPTSNLRTGAVASLAEHPLRRLYEAGIRISINTDDPVFFGTSMCDELRLAAHHFGFSAGELEAITLDGVAGSFLPAEEKRALGNELAAELRALRSELGV
jgi:adenosine deaminase